MVPVRVPFDSIHRKYAAAEADAETQPDEISPESGAVVTVGAVAAGAGGDAVVVGMATVVAEAVFASVVTGRVVETRTPL
jgi:hypothetical protein